MSRGTFQAAMYDTAQMQLRGEVEAERFLPKKVVILMPAEGKSDSILVYKIFY
jgi:hypothetical protein